MCIYGIINMKSSPFEVMSKKAGSVFIRCPTQRLRLRRHGSLPFSAVARGAMVP